MQVLKNLFGLNKKISWEETACVDAKNNAITLKEYLENNNYFQPNETFIVNNFYSCGFISSDRKRICITIPLPKSTAKISSYEITAGIFSVSDIDGNSILDVSFPSDNYDFDNYYSDYYVTIRITSSVNFNANAYSPVAINLRNLRILMK